MNLIISCNNYTNRKREEEMQRRVKNLDKLTKEVLGYITTWEETNGTTFLYAVCNPSILFTFLVEIFSAFFFICSFIHSFINLFD